MLTGETFPVEKTAAVLPPETQLGQRTNALWMGTHVVSGSATALIVRTGRDTEFGKVSERLKLRPPETEFEHGIRQFGFFLWKSRWCGWWPFLPSTSIWRARSWNRFNSLKKLGT